MTCYDRNKLQVIDNLNKNMFVQPSSRHILMISKGDDLFSGVAADTLKRHEDYAKKTGSRLWMVVLTSRSGFSPLIGIHFQAHPTQSSHFLCYARDAKKVVKQLMVKNQISHFDLLVSQDPFFCAHVALSLKKTFLCPLQIQDHSCFFSSSEFQKEKIFRPALICWGKRHLKKSDHIRVVNSTEKNAAEKILTTKIPIDVQPVPINTEIFQQSPSTEKILEFQKRLGISPSITEKKFLWVGRFSPEKNLTLVLCAFQQLRKTHPNISLLIAGPSRQQIASMTENGDGIISLGKIDYADLPSLYRCADALVSTSRYEGYGRVFIEALFCDLPVISTPTAGFLEAVPSDLQIRFEPDVNSLAKCLAHFIENHDNTEFFKRVGIFKNSFHSYESAMNNITQKWLDLMDKK